MESLLLHACCAPCAIIPFKLLAREGKSYTCIFTNSNIDSLQEYQLRLGVLRCFVAEKDIELIEANYEPKLWAEAIYSYAGVFPLIKDDAAYEDNRKRRQARCRACYRQRFEVLAKTAAARGLDQIATTLSISPYQFTELLSVELEAAALRHHINSCFVDYRINFSESVKTTQELGMYRQNYCGCVYSREEAALERQAKKNAKAKAQMRTIETD